jgi:hypothetical protein
LRRGKGIVFSLVGRTLFSSRKDNIYGHSSQSVAQGSCGPVAVDSKHYKVELENDQVRVQRIKDGANDKSVLHGPYGAGSATDSSGFFGLTAASMKVAHRFGGPKVPRVNPKRSKIPIQAFGDLRPWSSVYIAEILR